MTHSTRLVAGETGYVSLSQLWLDRSGPVRLFVEPRFVKESGSRLLRVTATEDQIRPGRLRYSICLPDTDQFRRLQRPIHAADAQKRRMIEMHIVILMSSSGSFPTVPVFFFQ